MKNRILLSKVVSLSVLLGAALISTASQAGDQKSAPWLKVDGQINFDGTGAKSEDYERNLRVQDAELRFEVLVREGIKMVVKTELERKLNEETRDAKLDLDQVIEGWTEGVQLMVVGDKMRFWIPENLAYKGRSGFPRGMLVFDIELMAIE